MVVTSILLTILESCIVIFLSSIISNQKMLKLLFRMDT